jgi:hypothetical protein
LGSTLRIINLNGRFGYHFGGEGVRAGRWLLQLCTSIAFLSADIATQTSKAGQNNRRFVCERIKRLN